VLEFLEVGFNRVVFGELSKLFLRLLHLCERIIPLFVRIGDSLLCFSSQSLITSPHSIDCLQQHLFNLAVVRQLWQKLLDCTIINLLEQVD